MKRTTRLSTIFLSILLIFTLFILGNISAAAADAEKVGESGDFEYTVSNNEVTITKYTGDAKDVTIPSTINGYPVTVIGTRLFYNNERLESLVFPSSIKEVQSYVFFGCTNLLKIYISDLEAWCSIYFGSIGATPFQDLDLNKTNHRSGSLYLNGELLTDFVIPSSIVSIKMNAFYNCGSIKNVIIPSSVKNIDTAAFRNCEGLENVIFNESLEIIGSDAFVNCKKLKRVVLPDSLVLLVGSTFRGCSSLESLHIGKNLDKNLTGYDLVGCYSLNSITVSSENERFLSENGILYNNDKTILIKYPAGKTEESYTIQDTVEVIGEYAFQGSKHLKNVTIPDSVKKIANGAFCEFDNLTEITISDYVTELGGVVFARCNNLSKVVIGNSVPELHTYAFLACKNLKEVILGKSIKTINKYAFDGCSGLREVSIPSSVKNVDLTVLPKDCVITRTDSETKAPDTSNVPTANDIESTKVPETTETHDTVDNTKKAGKTEIISGIVIVIAVVGAVGAVLAVKIKNKNKA